VSVPTRKEKRTPQSRDNYIGEREGEHTGLIDSLGIIWKEKLARTKRKFQLNDSTEALLRRSNHQRKNQRDLRDAMRSRRWRNAMWLYGRVIISPWRDAAFYLEMLLYARAKTCKEREREETRRSRKKSRRDREGKRNQETRKFRGRNLVARGSSRRTKKSEEDGSGIKDNDKLGSQLSKLPLLPPESRASREQRGSRVGFFHLDPRGGAAENLGKREEGEMY